MADGAAIELCANIVLRDDPHLFATALFAPEPARSRLMVLYALDCELSRATRASKESMIPRMRLQWWRDIIADAADGGAPKAHEVAGPLARLIQTDQALISDIHELNGGDVLSRMIAGYEQELDAPFAEDAYLAWAYGRFGARLGLAGSISPLGPEYGHDGDMSAASRVLALGLALRSARRLAAEAGHTLLPNVMGSDLAGLARGQISDALADLLKTLASGTLADLKALRSSRSLRGEALVAHLPIRREVRVIRRVARRPAALLELNEADEIPFQGLRLAWAAWWRRW